MNGYLIKIVRCTYLVFNKSKLVKDDCDSCSDLLDREEAGLKDECTWSSGSLEK